MIVITLFVTESAAPERPSTFVAPPFSTCSRTFSTTWYLRLEEAEPPAAVRQVVDVARAVACTKPFTSSISFGMNVAPTAAITIAQIR